MVVVALGVVLAVAAAVKRVRCVIMGRVTAVLVAVAVVKAAKAAKAAMAPEVPLEFILITTALMEIS